MPLRPEGPSDEMAYKPRHRSRAEGETFQGLTEYWQVLRPQGKKEFNLLKKTRLKERAVSDGRRESNSPLIVFNDAGIHFTFLVDKTGQTNQKTKP